MVAGMSVRNSEPGAGARKQSKTKPSVEAVAMARILEDSRYPPDLSEKIRAVQAVVPDKSEEEICIALHDSDYSPEDAISVLLDCGGGQGGWTTREGRKGKKKLSDGVDLVVAPGDKANRGRKNNSGTSKAATTRESHGGGVSVKTSRGKQNKPRRKPPASGGGGARKPPSRKPHPPQPVAEEVWDSVPVNGGDWDGQLQWETPAPDPVTTEPTYWVESEESPAEPGGDFPEAIPQPPAPLTSRSESTAVESTTHQPTVQQQAVQVIEPKTRKSRRIAKSLIPTIPVEMPHEEGDSLDLQFGSLGIDFGEQSPPRDYPSPTDIHRLSDDPGVIAVSSSGFSEGRASPPAAMEGPPGLTHPAVHESPGERPPSTVQQEQATSVYSTSAVSSEPLLLSSQPQASTASSTVTVTSSAGGGKQVPPVLYPPMMPQYPAFMTMYPGPGNYPDPSDMSRYQASVSLAYYQQSDSALSAAGAHYSTGDKFARADVSPSVSQASAGTQGGAGVPFVNYTYPGNMFYPMYFHQPHSIAPKPTSGSSYPVGGVSSYQAGANYSYPEETSSHDYKMYSGGVKSSSKTSSSDSMGLGSYKAQHYDAGKGSSGYQTAQGFGIQNQTQYMTGYMQAMPTGMPLPPMQHTALLQDASNQRATNASGGKSKNPYPNYWGGNP